MQGGECELEVSGRSQDPRRAGARILDTAEGVLIALRGCSLNEAFVEIVQTAKAHTVSTLSLADHWWRWPKARGPRTAMTPRLWPRALRGGTLLSRAVQAAAGDWTTKTMPFPALRTRRCRGRGHLRASPR